MEKGKEPKPHDWLFAELRDMERVGQSDLSKGPFAVLMGGNDHLFYCNFNTVFELLRYVLLLGMNAVYDAPDGLPIDTKRRLECIAWLRRELDDIEDFLRNPPPADPHRYPVPLEIWGAGPGRPEEPVANDR